MFQLDLSRKNSVEQFVKDLTSKKKRISVLINNAAVRLGDNDLTRKTTTDGFELTLATNYIGKRK